MIRFLPDEHVPRAVAIALRRAGVDLVTCAEASLRGRDDEHLLRECAKLRRVIVTNNTDFLDIARRFTEHAGIVYYSDQSCSIGYLVEMLLLMHEMVDGAEMVGRIELL